MMALKVTPPATKEEGVEEDEAEEGGATGDTRSNVLTRGCFNRS